MTDKTKTPKKRKPNVGSDPTNGSRVWFWQIGLYGFAFGASGLLVGLTFLRLLQGRFTPALAVASLVVAGLSWGLLISNEPASTKPDGVNVGTSEPKLTAFMNNVAESVGAPAPDAIYLVAFDRLNMMEETRFFGLKRGRRSLVLGLPYMYSMTKTELAAAVAHHMGHYAETDIEHGARGMRALRAGGDLIGIERDGFVNGVFGSYSRKMSRSVGGVGVAQEHAAESAAVAAYGTEAMLSGLAKIDEVGVAWDQILRDYVVPSLQAGAHPVGLFDGFEELLKSSKRAEDRAADVERRRSQESREFDPHNSPGERLANVSEWTPVPGSAVLEDGDGIAHTLLDATAKSAEIVVAAWASELMDSQTQPQSWHQLAEEVLSVASFKLAAVGFDQAEDVTAYERLQTVLDWSEAEWESQDELLKATKSLKRDDEITRRTKWVTAVVLEAAAATKVYGWQNRWDGPPNLVSAAGDIFDAEPLADLILQGKRPEAQQAAAELAS